MCKVLCAPRKHSVLCIVYGKRVCVNGIMVTSLNDFGARIEDNLPNAPRIDKPRFDPDIITLLRLNKEKIRQNFGRKKRSWS